ncbi:MAG TPA: helix-turn-helix transcriptional regulator [Candidatus Limnocylindrales bacterium]|nr:helix-turn-helix transcriptional regulator [Candidatus Limnocylindrales bacterium]
MSPTGTRRRVVVDDRPLAAAIGGRLRQARLAAGLTQQQLAGERYTKAYISALENGIAKPSMAALNYLAPRLGKTSSEILADSSGAWTRLEADLALAAGQWNHALDGYMSLLDGTAERGTRASLLVAVAESLCRLDRPAEAIRPAAEAASSFAELRRAADRARAEYWLASAHMQQDNPEEARSLLRGILDRVRDGLDLGADFATRLLIGLATLESYQGNATTALSYLEEARDHAAELDTRRRGVFLATMASAHRTNGDLEAAIRTGLQALALLHAAESTLEVGLVENQLAQTYAALGNVTRARETITRARLTAASDNRLLANLADTEAGIELAAGDHDRALRLAEEAIALAERTEHQKALLDGLATRARALAALGRNEDAAVAFEKAAALAERTGPASRRRQILSAWADAMAALGRHDEAYALARRALESR